MKMIFLNLFNVSIHRESGANLNRFRYAVMVTVLLMLGVGNAWGNSHSKHYGKAVLQNATGNGTVYLSTASGSNSGQVGKSNPETKDGTSWITWNCGESSSNDSKTYYARGTANAGYYWAGWANDKNATSYTASTTGKSFSTDGGSESNPKTTTIYGFFKPVTVTGATANVTINIEDAAAVYPTDASARTLSFTTANSNALTDFTYTPANGTTGKFTFSDWTRVSATQTTVKYQFQGSAGDWGGVNRTIEQNVTLTSKGTNGGSATCKITVNYPNVRITDVTADELINVTFDPAVATQPGVVKTVVFDVEYCDGTNNFDTPTFSGAGASHFGNVTTSYANGKLTVNYTYSGNKEEATHVATLTLKVKDAIGGTDATYGTKSVTITAQNAPIATDDAKVIAADGVTKLYQGTWAGALTEANKAANAGCTLWLLRDVTGLTAPQEVKNTMTLDLNSFTLSGTLTSAGGLLKLNTAGKILTITDAVSGGTIRVNGNIDGRIAAVEVLQGSLFLTKGDLLAQNANTGTTLANIYAAGVYLGAGATMGMTGGTVTANRTGASGNYCFGIYCAGTGSSASSVNLTGGTVTATFPNGSYAEGVFAAGNSIISNMMVTASSKTTSYALRVEDGHLVVNGGTYTATTTNQEARGLYSLTAPSNKNAVLVNNATFNVTAGTTDARGIWCRSTTTTMSGDPTDANVVLSGVTVNAKTDETTGTTDAYAIMSDAGVCLGIQSGTYTATATTQNTYALHTSGYTAVVNGTFNANSTTRTAFAIYVNGGITAVKAGTFTATAATHEVHATKILANAKLLTYGGTFRGICTNVASDGWATGSQVMSTGTLEAQGGTFIGEINKAGLTTAQTGCACGIYANTGSNVTLSNATLQGKANNKWLNGGATTTYYGTHGLLTKTTNKLTLTNCTISATSAYQYAFGIRAVDTPVGIKNCTVVVDTEYPYNYGIYTYGAANVEAENSTFTCISQQTYAYGSYVANGMLTATDCKFTIKTLQKNVSSAANNYLRGIYVAAGKKATLNGCTIDAQGNSSVGKEGYGIYVDGSADVDNCTVTVSNINTGAYAIYNSANTSMIGIASGKFKATATTTGVSTNGTAAAAKQQLYGGYYNTNNNLAKYLPAGYSIETLPSTSTEYGEGYRYAIRPGSNLTPVCKIGSTPYYTLEEALEYASKNASSSNKLTILMVKDYTLKAGNYTLPQYTTLLVPYKSDQTTAIGTTPSRASSYATRSPYRTLTFASGAKMTVYGTLEASAQQNSTDQTSSGEVRGPFGYIKLSENSSVTLEDGATLIAWGFVCGKGTITVKNGAKAYEMMSLGYYKGGNTTSTLYSNSGYKVFVITDYAYQNIECPITYHPGAQALGAAATEYFKPNDIVLVGTTNTSFFKMVAEEASADTWVRKEYDPKTDYTTWTMNNGASMSAIKLDSYSSEAFYLPITSNFRIIMNYGEMNLGGDIEFHPGAELIIKKEATGKVASGKTVVFYDGEDWCTGLGSSSKYYYPVTYSPSWKAATNATTNPRLAKYKQTSSSTATEYLPDAALFIQGKLEVSGYLYTTGDGNKATANRNSHIYSSNDDAGQIIYKTTAPTSTKTMYKCTHIYGLSDWGKGITDMLAGGNSTAYPAFLQNADGEYETTGGTAENSSWIYKNDHWVMVTTEGCFSVEQISGVKHYYAYPAGFVEVSSNTEDPTTHLFYDAATGERAFLKEADCTWWEVEPTPYDGNKYKCVNADHNGKYKYYEYKNGQWQEAVVTITWKNGSTTLGTYSNVGYKTIPKYLDAIPTKAASSTEYYTWIGWLKDDNEEGEFFAKDAELPFANANTTYYAVFETHKYSYAVVFKNYDGSVLQTSSWEAGQTPYYSGETPVKPATAAKIYSFTGWSPAFSAVTGSGVVYTAQFDAGTDRTYTVQWVNYNGTVLKEEQVVYGTSPSSPATPTRPNDTYYTYTFDAWSPAISAVTGNQTYTATYNYEKKVTKYAITFKNGSETVYTQNLQDGETPAFDGTTPTKAADAQYTYTFDGWSATEGGEVLASLPAVSGAAQTYYAHFSTTTNAYTIRWKSIDGKQLYETDENVEYGATPTYNGSNPTKPRLGTTVYTYDGWSSSIGGDKIDVPSVTGNATYYAHFSDDPVYTVTFNMQGHGMAPANQEIVSGQTATTPEDPIADGYDFGGWYKEAACSHLWNFGVDVVTANTTIFAKWTPISYNIEYTLNGGSVTAANPANYNIETATFTLNNPTKTGYDFAGWTGSNGTTPQTSVSIAKGSTGDKSYTANWTPSNDTHYTVKHWQQNVADDDYTEVTADAQTLQGTTDTYTEAEAKNYTGFTAQTFTQGKINGDGSTIVHIYYNRISYTVTWKDMIPSPQTLQEQSLRYGATIPAFDYQKQADELYAYIMLEPRWKCSNEGVTAQTTVNGNMELHAQYKGIPLTLVVNNEQTISDNVTLNSTTVRVSGALRVAPSASLTTTDLILEAQANTSGEITGNVQLNPGGHAYFDLYINDTEPRHWHAFSVPFQIDLRKAGNPIQINGETLTLGSGYDILFYDGAVRAEQGKVADCWKYVEDGDSILYPGKAYMIASASRAIVKVRFTKADLAPIAFSGTINVTGGSGVDGGWNGIGNPTTYHAIMDAGPKVAQVHNGGKIGADGYTEYNIENLKYVVGKAVYVQVIGSGQSVDIYHATGQGVITPKAPARRNTRADINKEYLSLDDYYKVSIAQENSTNTCNVYVLDEEDKEDAYVIGHDLSKFGLNTALLQMWVNRYDNQLSLNTTAPVDGVAYYPLGINAPKAGEYTISLQSWIDDEHALYLTYDGETVWNLSDGAFSLYLEKGTSSRYGLRLVEKAPHVATGTDEAVVDAQGETQKVLINDHVYIIRGNNIYTIDGQLVK